MAFSFYIKMEGKDLSGLGQGKRFDLRDKME
jgi:hypothetical protein